MHYSTCSILIKIINDLFILFNLQICRGEATRTNSSIISPLVHLIHFRDDWRMNALIFVLIFDFLFPYCDSTDSTNNPILIQHTTYTTRKSDAVKLTVCVDNCSGLSWIGVGIHNLGPKARLVWRVLVSWTKTAFNHSTLKSLKLTFSVTLAKACK